MTIHHCTLDGERYPMAIAHLLPGDVLKVECPQGTLTVEADPLGDFGWVAVHCDDPGPRTGRYSAALRLAQNTPLRMRRVMTLATRAIRTGGAAVIEYGQVRTYPERTYPERTERGPVGFERIAVADVTDYQRTEPEMTLAQDYAELIDMRPDPVAQPVAYRYWCGERNARGQSEQMKSGNARRMLAAAAEPKRIPAGLKNLDAAALTALRGQVLEDLDVAGLLADLCQCGDSAHEIWQVMHRHMQCPDMQTNERWSAALYRLAAIDAALALTATENGA